MSSGFFKPLWIGILSVIFFHGIVRASLDGAESAPEPIEIDHPFLTQASLESEAPLPDVVPSDASERDELETLQKSMDDLKEQIGKMKKEIEKKQNAPDPNKKFTSKLGGQVNADAVMVNQDAENAAFYGDVNNEFGFREIRLWAKGEGYGNLAYELALGFNNGVSLKNVVLTAKEMPIMGDMRIGYFKVESGISYMENVYNNTFVDWESDCKTFQIGRRLGVGSTHYSEGKNIRFFTGVFTGQNLAVGEDDYADANNDNAGIILNTRLSAVPIYRETADGDLTEVLHLGGSFRWVDPGRDSETGAKRKTNLRYTPVGWMGGMPSLLKGGLDTDSSTTTNVEAAWQRNRLGVIGEGFIGTYDGYDNAYGVTVTGRYLLTPGAYQNYDKKNGTFSDIHIPQNLRFVDYENRRCFEGFGVWEIATQWAWTDLSNLRDAPGTGVYYGKVNQTVVALNWLWNPQTRWGLDWIHAMPETGIASANDPSTEETANDTLAAQVRFIF